jgi:hypothetical protein
MRASSPFLAVALCVAAGTAPAQSNPYYIGISQSFGYEDNLIRLRDGQATPAGLFKSDTVSSTALVAGINQSFGRQRLSGSGSVRANRYRNNSAFDNEGYNLNLGLQWQTIESLSGSVSVGADRSLRADLRDINGAFINGTNSQSTRDIDLRVRYGLFGPWALQGGLNWRQDEYSAPQSAFRNYDQQGGNIGVRWRPGGSTELGLGISRTRVDYPELLVGRANPNDRRVTDNVDLSAYWAPTGASTLSARVSRGRTDYDPFPDRNFTATTGALEWGWQATGLVRLDTRLSRDTGQDSDRATTAYSRTTDSLRLTMEYSISAKLLANLGVGLYRRDIVGSGVFVSGISGRDDGSSVSLGLRWAALRSLSLGCSAIHEQRNASDNPALNDAFRASALTCFGQFVLQ